MKVYPVQDIREHIAIRQEFKSLFIGRQQEISFLNQILSKAILKESQFLFITGEAGVGKSRLVSEVLYRKSDEILLFSTECPQHGEKIPYFSIYSLLSKIIGLPDKANLKTIDESISSWLKKNCLDDPEDEVFLRYLFRQPDSY